MAPPFHRSLTFLTVLFLSVLSGTRADNVPVAPLLPDESEGVGPVYTLESNALRVKIVPSEGGITSLRFWQGEEILESPLRIVPASHDIPSAAEVPWESRGWRTHEGNQVVMWTRNLGPPLSCRVIHLIELPVSGSHMRLTTRITGTGPGNQRLLKPSAQWAIKPPEHMWTRGRFRILARRQDFSAWSVDWRIEDLTASLDSDITSRMKDTRVDMQSSPGQLQLPPQGWTLICSLHLQINRGNPDQPAIEVLQSWPASLN